jgi:nucleotidyltransferase/DNA polymerase involved in DNA repair
MAVGGMSMLCTCNYRARQYGVRSGMPGFIGKKLCPELTLIPLHFPKYRAASVKVRAVFEKYDLNYLPMSLDEVRNTIIVFNLIYLFVWAYLNLTEVNNTMMIARVCMLKYLF